MRILVLEPYHGGSHKAFLDGWCGHSGHVWTVLGLPAYKWKWRMRHGAITFAELVGARVAAGEAWDIIFCSDMLNLAEFLGLAPARIRRLPTVAYFHENQLTYPVRHEDERDYQFVLTNMTTALAATNVWFNSVFHRDSFLGALPAFLRRMPDYQPMDAADRIAAKSCVKPPGIGDLPSGGRRRAGPIRILWAARWEHDKDPDTFFEALTILKSQGVDFRVSVLGERFRETPAIFAWAREHFRGQIDHWGYQETRDQYEAALGEADVIVSTAKHEFFGISVVEAIAAGAYPLLPKRLAYPEILGPEEAARKDGFFYDGGAEELSGRLATLATRARSDHLWEGDSGRGIRAVARFSWNRLAPLLDGALDDLGPGISIAARAQ